MSSSETKLAEKKTAAQELIAANSRRDVTLQGRSSEHYSPGSKLVSSNFSIACAMLGQLKTRRQRLARTIGDG